MKISFYVYEEDNKTYRIGHEELAEYANVYGIENIISGRYSWLFVFNLMMLEKNNGITPFSIIDEIKSLEGVGSKQQTKPASEFKGIHLKGLWHNHFFAAHPSVIANNISNHIAFGKLKKIAEKVFDQKKSPVVTKEMVNEFSHKVVVESMEERASNGKLTGEWIVFAKHQGQNYYLCINTHEAEDENIAKNIKTACLPQFPFLGNYVS